MRSRPPRRPLARGAAWLTAALLTLLAGGCDERKPLTRITGRVVDRAGLPIRGVHVGVAPAGGAWEALARTGDAGTFDLRVSAVPYDLAAFKDGYHVYQGVSRTDPTVRFFYGGLLPDTVREGSIQGVLAAPCSEAGCAVTDGLLAFEPGPGNARQLGGITSAAPFLVTARWAGAEQVAGGIHALTWGASPDTAPLAYWCGTADVAVTAGQTATVDLPPLQRCPTTTVSGSIVAPEGSSLSYLQVVHSTRSEALQLIARTVAPPDPTFAIDAPSAPGLSTLVVVAGTGPSGESFTSGARVRGTSLALTLHPAPALAAPPDGATVGKGDRFSWSPVAGAIHLFTIGGVEIATAASEIRLPDLTPFGLLGFPSGFPSSWRVTAHGPVAGMDDFLGPSPASPADVWYSMPREWSVTFR